MSRLLVACALLTALVLASLSTLAAGAPQPAPRPAADAASAAEPRLPSPDQPRFAPDGIMPRPTTAGGVTEQMVASGKLVVAVVNTQRYPFFYTDATGNLVGGDVDLARDIARELGLDLMFNRTATTFDGVVDLVATGQADIGISKLSVTLARAQKVRFTRPYIELAQGLLLNRVALAGTGHNHDRDLVPILNRPGTRIGAVKGTSYVGFGRTLFPQADLVEFPDKQSMFAAVSGGDVMGVLYDENELKQYIFEKPDRLIEVKVQMLPKRTDPIAIAVRDPQLQYWLDTYLELKDVDQSVNELLRKYPRPEAN